MGIFSSTVLSLVILISSSEVLAQSNTSTDENVIIMKKDDRSIIFEGSSEHNRMAKKFFLAAEVGYAISPAISTGLSGAYFLNRNNLIQVDGTEGKFPLLWLSGIKTKTFSATLKHFYGNSFYTKSGVAHRTITVHSRDDFISNSYANSFVSLGQEYGRSEVLAVDFSIGNQWQWENFTLGCDWIGLMVPATTLRSSYETTGLSESEKRDLDDSWLRISKATTAQLLRFYIGAAF